MLLAGMSSSPAVPRQHHQRRQLRMSRLRRRSHPHRNPAPVATPEKPGLASRSVPPTSDPLPPTRAAPAPAPVDRFHLQGRQRLRGQGCRQLLRLLPGLRAQGQPDRPGRRAGAMRQGGHRIGMRLQRDHRLPLRAQPVRRRPGARGRMDGRPARASARRTAEACTTMLYAQVHLTLPAWVHESVDTGRAYRGRRRQGRAGDRPCRA